MGFIGNIVERIRKMLDRNAIKKVIGREPDLTKTMAQYIELWRNEYEGNAEWIKSNLPSLRIENGICREFADVAVNEMDVKISNEKLMKLYTETTKNINEALQEGVGLGSFVIKPVGNGQSEIVPADKFIPINFGLDGMINDCAFLDVREQEDGRFINRLERHRINESGFLEIENIAFKSSSRNGYEGRVELSALQEWANLPEIVSYPGMTSMDFGYYKNPVRNSIDDTSCGVSIFNDAREIIKRADTQASRLDWEFESGERAVHVSAEAIKRGTSGRWDMPKLNARLYRGLDTSEGDLLKEYSPQMREASFLAGLQEYYRQIEFIVGLAYGDLSNAQDIDKTATEIKASKQRKYNRVTAIQEKLKECIEGYITGLAFHEGLLTSGYEVVISFSDSILTDEQADRDLMMREIASGIRQAWEYRVKYLGEDEETAKANVNVLDNRDVIL